VNIDHNTLTSNDVGVYVFDTNASSTSAHNRVRASTFDGIVLDVVNNNRVAYNKTDQNNGPGIGVYDSSQNNTLEANLVQGNSDSGILLDDGNTNSVESNHVRNNGTSSGDTTDGIRVNVLSTGNTLRDNHLKGNVTHDCHDNSVGTGTAGTANFWIDNEGQSSKPPGLCRGDDDDGDAFEMSTTFGWDPNYAWYLEGVPIEAADYNWPAAYTTVDTATLLQLVPQIRLGVVPETTNPYE
jgi:parallel beta-helix repeat protein